MLIGRMDKCVEILLKEIQFIRSLSYCLRNGKIVQIFLWVN